MLHLLLAGAILLAPSAPDADLDAILEGVPSLPGTHGALPGEVVAFGERSFAVAVTGDPPHAVIAGTRHGRGRVLAAGHGALLQPWNTDSEDDERFLTNACAWLGDLRPDEDDSRGPLGRLDVGLFGRNDGLRALLEGHGARVQELDPASTRSLAKRDLVVWTGGELDDRVRKRLMTFVKAGGGLLVGHCPWGVQQIWDGQGEGRSIKRDMAQNLALFEVGLAYSTATRGAESYSVDRGLLHRAHAGSALEVCLSVLRGEPALRPADRVIPEPGDASELVRILASALPEDDPRVLPHLIEAMDLGAVDGLAPAEGRPAKKADVRTHLVLTVAQLVWGQLPVDEVPAAPGHEHFPGAVPADAERIDHRVEVQADDVIPGSWQSTGLYAPAGEPVTAVSEAAGWQLRIGAHADTLWHKDTWSRWPEVTLQQPLGAESEHATRHASPFGGLIYLVPTGEAPRTTTGFVIEGAVEAPLYVHGDEESLADWPRRREAPAPWGELVCDGVVITVPAGALRALDDPAALTAWWSEAMACYPELLGAPLHPTGRPERLVEDLQISAGWMHSGYPVMTHGADRTDRSDAVDLATLSTAGNWGYFHEFGHNAQDGRWTFAGTGEVTCNIFSLYLGERMAGIEPWTNPWLEGQKRKLPRHLKAGAPYDRWKADPGLALLLYAIVQREHGWEPFATALQSYHDGVRTPTDEAKRDAWLRRLSHATGKDLGPYFEAMGVPTSEAARAELSADGDLEPWLPVELAP